MRYSRALGQEYTWQNANETVKHESATFNSTQLYLLASPLYLAWTWTFLHHTFKNHLITIKGLLALLYELRGCSKDGYVQSCCYILIYGSYPNLNVGLLTLIFECNLCSVAMTRMCKQITSKALSTFLPRHLCSTASPEHQRLMSQTWEQRPSAPKMHTPEWLLYCASFLLFFYCFISETRNCFTQLHIANMIY